MPRSRRAVSQSVSSNGAEPLMNGSMPPPSPPSPARVSPVTRRKAPSVIRPSSSSTIPPLKSAHAPSQPSVPKFILAVIISSAAESAAHYLASSIGVGDLANISKRDVDVFELGALLAWRVVLMGAYWFGGFDAVDVASLSTLLQTPVFILLHYFYNISAATLLTTCTITILAPALPFYLLRSLSVPHSGSVVGTGKSTTVFRNRHIITDPVTTLATAATATIIFTVTLGLAFASFLPVFLILHFRGLRDLTFAHDTATALPTLIMWLAPAGIASTQFLFRPAEGASSSSEAATGPNSIALAPTHFDPATATFVEHVYHNAWGWYTSRQKELFGRAITLGILLVAETVMTTWGTIQGVEFVGALGYAGVWATGVAALGFALNWIGGPTDNEETHIL